MLKIEMYEGNNNLILSMQGMWKYLKIEEDGFAINYVQDYKSIPKNTRANYITLGERWEGLNSYFQFQEIWVSRRIAYHLLLGRIGPVAVRNVDFTGVK